MTKFTKDAPFEFEFDPGRTVRIWRNDAGRTASTMDGWPTRGLTAALHAFIEAERDEWAYTNDEHTEARKGRWTVRDRGSADRTSWALGHTDFPGSEWDEHASGSGARNAATARGVMRDFLAWHAAQNQPAEPTGLGAVVEVPELQPCEPGATERFTLTGESSHNQRPWVCEGDSKIALTWRMLTDRGPVTILSPGVDA